MSSEPTNHLNHSTWECKYHVVFTPKYRRKELYGYLRSELRDVLHRLSRQKDSEIVKEHLMPDHVHMLLSIPPKHSVAHVIGFMKGKSSIWIAQNIKNRRRNFAGHKFWARGYFVSTVGADERTVRNYIQTQEKQDKRLDDLFNR